MNRIMVLAALTAVSTGFAHTVRVDFDHGAHFSSYKTYSLTVSKDSDPPQALFPNQLMERRIAAFIEEALAARGLHRVPTGGDLHVTYHVVVTEQPQFVTFGSGFGPGWGWGSGWGPGWGAWGPSSGFSTTTVTPFYEGTLVIDMVDANRNKLIFQGTSTQSVSSRPNRNTERLGEAVNRIMTRFPPQK